MTEKAVTKLEELNLADRFLFSETMEDGEVYQAAVSILLENEIHLKDRPETEKEYRKSKEKKPVLSGTVGCIPVRTGQQGF